MVYYRTIPEINNAFQDMVGLHDYLDPSHRPDGQRALELASLQPGQSVLDIGAGSGRLIADAKRAVSAGFCVAVDAVQGFLDIDIPWQLNRAGLTVHPQGTSQQQVHLLCANVTDGALHNRITALPGAPQTFDCIFALHLLNTIPADQRLQLLRNLRKLLKPAGRLIVTMSARFTDIAPTPAETTVPVQFRSTGHTEAPGSILLMQSTDMPRIPVPQGISRPLKQVHFAMQIAPDRFWVTAAQQARDAAIAAGFLVDTSRPIGKGDCFGLPVLRRSPPQAMLNSMSNEEISAQLQGGLQHGYACNGRTNETVLRRIIPNLSSMSSPQQDYALVMRMQATAAHFAARVVECNEDLPEGVVAEQAEHEQVGVMVVLRKG